MASLLDMSLDEIVEKNRSSATSRDVPTASLPSLQRFRTGRETRDTEGEEGEVRWRNFDRDSRGGRRGGGIGSRGGGGFGLGAEENGLFGRRTRPLSGRKGLSSGDNGTRPSPGFYTGNFGWRAGGGFARGRGFRDGGVNSGNNRYDNVVLVANLDYSVLQSELEELFSSVGGVVKTWIDYDRTDRSEGSGGCVFRTHEDAIRAIERYNAVSIEGQPIRLELKSDFMRRGGARTDGSVNSFLPERCPW